MNKIEEIENKLFYMNMIDRLSPTDYEYMHELERELSYYQHQANDKEVEK